MAYSSLRNFLKGDPSAAQNEGGNAAAAQAQPQGEGIAPEQPVGPLPQDQPITLPEGFTVPDGPAPTPAPRPAPSPAPTPAPSPAPRPAPRPAPKPEPKPGPKPMPTDENADIDELLDSFQNSQTRHPPARKPGIGLFQGGTRRRWRGTRALSLPELWYVDAVCVLITIGAVIGVATHWGQVQVAIAVFLIQAVDVVLAIGALLLIPLLAGLFFFGRRGRRRRRW